MEPVPVCQEPNLAATVTIVEGFMKSVLTNYGMTWPIPRRPQDRGPLIATHHSAATQSAIRRFA